MSVVPLLAQDPQPVPGAQMRGGVLYGKAVLSWGDRLRLHPLPQLTARELAVGPFGPGGCLAEVNGDSTPDLVLHQGGEMVWLEAPHWRKHVIDTEADFQDCLQTTLFGRPGVLVIHRGIQVRFYEIPESPEERWPYREIYSIYTPSWQGGLLVADVDGDGFTDILCGNYWIRSPGAAGLPWRLFAINNWWEQERSAMLRLVLAPVKDAPFPRYIAAESEAAPARLAWFERPKDPTQFWRQHTLNAPGGLRRLHALAAADLDGDGAPEIIAGENAGSGSRLFLWESNAGYRPRLVGESDGFLQVWTLNVDADWRLDILALSPASVRWWQSQRRR